ncbi:LysR family transcriptional regulator [Burkholderia sp. Ax-1719]|uniref:LysR family transcriptional regulator n=1 Tax=Burkholderia sp. Ax-1719 TaxID=2608334 RepID=UPI0014211189|nr:LysR family transcriptional regulator [Burkholderia sp. Ax-1719]NIE65348.1 LysR family transcriptional regulator [Burkholderia sp. Ax-1719]
MDINGCLAFTAVVESGSFAAAARELGLPRSTVSARVAALETRLGVRLLRRSTRHIALTDDGEAWYASVGGAIATLREAERRGIAGAGVLSGTIRLSTPIDFSEALLAEAIATFIAAHPHVRIDVQMSNDVVDFVSGNVDLAIRGGAPGGNEAVARRIAGFRFGRYASPSHHGTNTLAFAAHLPRAKGSAAHVQTNSFALLKQLAIRGAGVAVLPAHLCTDALASGQLIEIDAENSDAEEIGLFIVYPSRRDMSTRVRAFAQHLTATLEAHFAQ